MLDAGSSLVLNTAITLVSVTLYELAATWLQSSVGRVTRILISTVGIGKPGRGGKGRLGEEGGGGGRGGGEGE